MNRKENILFVILAGVFVTNALMAEFIGTKIFSLEQSLGFPPLQWSLFSGRELNADLSAGVILWPIVFVMTDVINEYYGRQGVRFLSYLTSVLILYAFLTVFFAIRLEPATWWQTAEDGMNLNEAFARMFGQGLWIIFGSLTAFLIGQFLDVTVFQYLRRMTGAKQIWLRATGSTLVSQLIDSFVVLFIAFYLGANWTMLQVVSVGTMNYLYKFTVAVLLTPLLYVIHALIDNYLGKERAHRLAERASRSSRT